MFTDRVFSIKNDSEFQNLALEIFKFQFENNTTYRSFCDLLYIHPADVKTVDKIPFLPIEFFKSKKVVSTSKEEEIIFTSSGTTGSLTSKHYVQDLSVYEKSFINGFELFYGPISEYTTLALLPSYLERTGSSLVYMIDYFIKNSKYPESNFYLNNLDDLVEALSRIVLTREKVLLIGVSFALLDLIEKETSLDLSNIIVMETGGMKGRRKEMIRNELHDHLKKGLKNEIIHSEYGMTELLSQAYSKENGIFNTPPWMKILTRDTEDPLSIIQNKSGGINIIDLANFNSCAFIATQDLGKVHHDGSFEIIGRFDNSDIRGCNLMAL